MQNWFETKAKYIRVDDEGKERKVNETYLVDAVTCTDAEARLIEQLKTMVRGEFAVGKVAESNIIDIFPHETGQWWWKAKIQMIVIDEQLGKEKKVNHYFLVAADNAKQALERLEEGLSYLLVPYTIASITLSAIIDVFPYFGENMAIPANFKQILKQDEELKEVYNSDEEETE